MALTHAREWDEAPSEDDEERTTRATRQTALAIAIVERAGDALTLLLARGASCAVDDDEEIGAGSTPLHYVAARGRLAVVQQLLAAAAESAGSAEPTAVGLRAVNALDERGFSPLHHSVRSGKLAVVRALLEQGALPNVISGTSGGSIVAGFLTMRTDDELLSHVHCHCSHTVPALPRH
jgi:ankyrin repeat protein